MAESFEADQTIVVKFLADTRDAITKHKEFMERVKAMKEALKTLAKESNASYKDMADAMVKAFKDKTIQPGMDKAQLAAAKAEVQEYSKIVKGALALIQTEVKNTSRIWSQASKDVTIQQQNEAKVIQDSQKKEQEAKRQATQEWIKNNQQQVNAIKYLEQEQQKAQQTTTKTGGIGGLLAGLGGSLGGIASVALGVIGITSAISTIRQMANYLRNAATQAKDFVQSVYAMSVGIRAMQRAGVNITIQDMASQIDNLKQKFGVFSRVDLVQGSAAFLNLNRDMGFTKEQLFSLQEAIATLAIVNGRSMDEVQKTVALALSSGYTEGLQRLGVSINRVTIAQEAARLGFEGGYMALNEQQRALATYNLIIKKTAIYMEDLLTYQKSLPGQMDTTTKNIQDQTVALGQSLLPAILKVTQAYQSLLEVLTSLSNTFLGQPAKAEFFQKFVEQQQKRLGHEFSPEEIMQWEQVANTIWETASWRGAMSPQQIFEKYRLTSETWNPEMGNEPVANLDWDKAMEAAQQAVEKNLDEILSIQEDFQEESINLWNEYQKDLDDLAEETADRQKEIFDNWAEEYTAAEQEHANNVIEARDEHDTKLLEIEQKYLDDLAKAEDDYNNSVSDVWTQYYSSITQAQENYHNQQIDAEIAYQERLRKIQEGFLFDLEGALQERNARKVLEAIRRYNLDRKQADREYEQQKAKMARDYQEQMEQLARQRDERLNQLYEELTQRYAAIEDERTKEIAAEDKRNKEAEDKEKSRWDKQRRDLAAEYKKRGDKEEERYQEAKTKRDEQYGEDLTALINHMNDRYDEIATALGKELGFTSVSMQTLLQVLQDALGPEGAQRIFWSYAAAAQAAAQTAANAFSRVSALNSLISQWLPSMYNQPAGPSNEELGLGGGMATGGLAIVNQPTRITMGEGGWEAAAFLPLTKPTTNPKLITNIGGGKGDKGRTQIEILLGAGLEGRIIDQALNTVADVIIRRVH